MKQTLITLVEDKPGVLNRIASLFRRRNFNIESVVSGSSETPDIARLTIVVDEIDRSKRGTIYFNLLNLVNVVAVKDVSELPCITREFILVKIEANTEKFNEIEDLVNNYGAKVVENSSESIIVEAADEKETLDQLVESLKPYNITEIMRTGKMSMRKGRTHNVSSDKNNVKSEQEKWQPEKLNVYHN